MPEISREQNSSFIFHRSGAGQSFKASGKIGGKGKEKSRLQLEGVTDNRIAIAAKQFRARNPLNLAMKLVDAIRYVRVEMTGHGEVSINLGSLERIGINKKEARIAAGNGTLPVLIRTRSQEAKTKLNQLDSVVGKYETNPRRRSGLVAVGDPEQRLLLSKAQLQKITWYAINTVKTEAKILRTGRERILVQQVANDQFRMVALRTAKHLGKGSFGEVSSAFEISQASRVAIKLARTESDLKREHRLMPSGEIKRIANIAKHDVQAEAEMLNYLHDEPSGQPPIRGIQAAPEHTAFNIEDGNMIGYMGALYDHGDFSSARPLFQTAEQKADAIQQLFSGLAHAESKHVQLGDIKWENILVRNDPNHPGEFEVHLSDLGGASRMGPDFEMRVGTGSRRYFVSADRGKINIAKRDRNNEAYQQVQHRRDVFALGVVAFELLTGEAPYDSTPDADLIEQNLARPEIQEKLSEYPGALEFFTAVLNCNADERPLPSEALQQWNQIVTSGFTNLAETLQARGVNL